MSLEINPSEEMKIEYDTLQYYSIESFLLLGLICFCLLISCSFIVCGNLTYETLCLRKRRSKLIWSLLQISIFDFQSWLKAFNL